jgi:hypothetical protein
VGLQAAARGYCGARAGGADRAGREGKGTGGRGHNYQAIIQFRHNPKRGGIAMSERIQYTASNGDTYEITLFLKGVYHAKIYGTEDELSIYAFDIDVTGRFKMSHLWVASK